MTITPAGQNFILRRRKPIRFGFIYTWMLLRIRSMNQIVICPQVVDPESGKILGPGVNGELLSKGPCYMRGYYNQPATTAAKIDDDDWIRTGMVSISQCPSVHTVCPFFRFSTFSRRRRPYNNESEHRS